MSVKLISITRPVEKETKDLTLGEYIAYIARVSNPTNQHNHETSDKLIRYLLKHKHFSPFEMVHLTIQIDTTRDIGRQILRHRSFCFQEHSQRYSLAPGMVESPFEARTQDLKNRQASHVTEDQDLIDWFNDAQFHVSEITNDYYQQAIDNGIAKELARKLLPEGLTVTRMYMCGSLRSWIHYCDVRCGIETQLEHRDIALAIHDIINEQLGITES